MMIVTLTIPSFFFFFFLRKKFQRIVICITCTVNSKLKSKLKFSHKMVPYATTRLGKLGRCSCGVCGKRVSKLV